MPTVAISSWGDAVFLSLSNALNTFLNAIPQVIGALLIIIIGWIIAGALARLVSELLSRVGADRVFAERGGEVYGAQSEKIKPSIVAGELVKWLIRLVFLVAAANVLGMTQISELLNQVLLWIPNLIVAAVILLIAPLLARFVRGAIEVGAGQMGFTNAPLLGRIAEIAIIGVRSRSAVATPLTRFVEPGPSVEMHTPGLPVSRPWVAAMKAAACSWRVMTRACSTLNLRTGIAFCPSWMRRSYASRRALDETGAADRDMPPQGQDPAPGSAAHDFGHCLAASERGQVARHPG